jgi:hypothetical protein
VTFVIWRGSISRWDTLAQNFTGTSMQLVQRKAILSAKFGGQTKSQSLA